MKMFGVGVLFLSLSTPALAEAVGEIDGSAGCVLLGKSGFFSFLFSFFFFDCMTGSVGIGMHWLFLFFL